MCRIHPAQQKLISNMNTYSLKQYLYTLTVHTYPIYASITFVINFVEKCNYFFFILYFN